jgi:phytoene synthase|tara:strand:- start:15 stop:869 length:855 start_codon:yes stop_codon:yes gene_type:complete
MVKNQSLIYKHAKSFNWAGFFLSKETFSKCSILYDFCRSIDDIADGDEALSVRRKKFIRFKSNFINKNFSNSIIKNIHTLLKYENISKKIVEDLFDGIESDLKPTVVISNKKDLLIYSYRVAGTVGLMMAKILKVKDVYALKGAIDLGIAMQLTNIARDVVEDKKKGRSYVKHEINSIKEVIEIADNFYKSSFEAIKYIPLISRFSIIVARRVYKKIGDNILKIENIERYNSAGKTYVSNTGKIFETLLSFYDFIKLFFINSKIHLKENEHLIISEEINLNERI